MKWSFLIETRVLTVINLLIFAAVVWLLVIPGYTSQIKSLERQNRAKDETIVELARIARYAITNQYDKIKTGKEGSIILDLTNMMSVADTATADTIVNKIAPQPEKKKTFWNRIFNRE